MRKLFTIIFLFIGFSVSAQTWSRPNNSIGSVANGIGADRFIYLPTGCGTPSAPARYDSVLEKAGLFYDTCNARLWIYSPKLKDWSNFTGGGGGTAKRDTAYFKFPLVARDSVNGVDTGFVASISHGDSIFIHAEKVGDSLKFYRMDGSELAFFVGTANTLQSVVAAGDTTSNDFSLTDGNGNNLVSIRNGGSGGVVEVVNPENGDQTEYSAGALKFHNNGKTIDIKSDSITDFRTAQLPDASGVLVTSVNGNPADVNGNVDIEVGGSGTVTNVSGTSPITVTSGTTTPNISLDNTAVTPGSYTWSNFTVDAKGRLTAASSGSAPTLQQSYDVDHQGINAGGNSVHITNADTISLKGQSGEEYAYDEATMDFSSGDADGYFVEVFLNVSDYPNAPISAGDSLTTYVYHDGGTIDVLRLSYGGESGGQQYYVLYPIAYLVDSIQKVVFTEDRPVNLIANLPDTTGTDFKTVVSSPSGKLYTQTSTSGSTSLPADSVTVSVSGLVNINKTNAQDVIRQIDTLLNKFYKSIRQIDSSSLALERFNSEDTVVIKSYAPKYKEYVANIFPDPSDISAPTISLINNEIGTVTWSRNDVGEFFIDCTNCFTSGKTFITFTAGEVTGDAPIFSWYPLDGENDTIVMQTISTNSGLPQSGCVSVFQIKIQVYN